MGNYFYEVDDIVEYQSKENKHLNGLYRVIEVGELDSCVGCGFDTKDSKPCVCPFDCDSTERDDFTEVIFVKLSAEEEKEFNKENVEV